MENNASRYLTWRGLIIFLFPLLGLISGITGYMINVTVAEHAALPYHSGSPATKALLELEDVRSRVAVLESRLTRIEQDLQEIKQDTKEITRYLKK